MLICPEPIARSLTRRCAEPGNLSAADSGAATLSIGTESICALERCGRPAITLADHPRDGRTMQGSSISAVRIERTAHPVPRGGVSADQRDYVVRDRIELSTFRFSAGLSFPRPTGSVTTKQPASPAKTPGRAGMPWCRKHPVSPRSPQKPHNPPAPEPGGPSAPLAAPRDRAARHRPSLCCAGMPARPPAATVVW